MNHFPNNETLEVHKEYCSRTEAVKTIMPVMKDKDSDLVFPQTISFKNLNRFMKHPFVVYADFEAFLENIDSCEPDNRKSFTEKYQKHKPCGFCLKLVCLKDTVLPESLLKPVLYRAKNENYVAQIFEEKLEEVIKEIYKIYDKPKRMIYTRKDKEKFLESKECWICKKEFDTNPKNENYKKEITVISLENLEEQLIMIVILNLRNQNSLLSYFII